MKDKNDETLSGVSGKSESEHEQKEVEMTFKYHSKSHRKIWQVWGFWLALEISVVIILVEVIV